MPLVRIPSAFDDPGWIFELKYDGFRALAFIEEDQCRLVSRNGHTFRQFAPLTQALARRLPNGIYDGEIVCLDDEGRSQFNALLLRRAAPVFALFDVLWLEGEDVRQLPLLERKRRLFTVTPKRPQCLLLVQHIEAQGIALFQQVSSNDLEGVVGKWAAGSYLCDVISTSWVKIKNRGYSHAVHRHELFETRRRRASSKSRRLVLA